MNFLMLCFLFGIFVSSVEGRCTYPGRVENGHIMCEYESDVSENLKCKIECFLGYRLNGPEEVVCRNGIWSALLGKCEAVTCPPLKHVPLAQVKPESCVTQPSRFGAPCRFYCPPGYTGGGVALCNMTGQWDRSNVKFECIDRQPPQITCPDHITVQASAGQSYVKVDLPIPSYSDNSQEFDPNAKLKFESRLPLGGTRLEIGKHLVEYVVKDDAGLRTWCNFYVKVEDKEPPKFSLCPSDITKVIDGEPYAIVVWEEPRASDNSGEVLLRSNRHNHARVAPGTTTVIYTAEDYSGNKATCSFKIHVKEVCKDVELNHPLLSCTIPTGDLSKCAQEPSPGFPLKWKDICRKTCKTC